MPLQFGIKKKDAPESTGTGNYLRRVKPGETKVRFLDELDDWIEYWEHYTPDGKGFPCTNDKSSCPGCLSTNADTSKARKRYATQVYLIDANQVLPFAIPVTLSNRMAMRSEKNDGTITNRDYALMRQGSGLETEYDVDQEDKYPMDQKSLQAKITVNIQDCLREAYEAVWGVEAPSEKPALDVPPTEPASQSESAATQAPVMDEAQIRKMDRSELRDLCETQDIDWERADTKDDLIKKLLAELGE